MGSENKGGEKRARARKGRGGGYQRFVQSSDVGKCLGCQLLRLDEFAPFCDTNLEGMVKEGEKNRRVGGKNKIKNKYKKTRRRARTNARSARRRREE
jgi:hypothetical protein